MKSLSNILHKTPWWALILGAIAVMVGLAFFVTPYHIIQYRQSDDTAQSHAIKREIDNTFAEQAINIARNVLRGMRDASREPETRAELDAALQGLEEARAELREAGSEVLRSKRDALQMANEAARKVQQAVREARREAERALKEGGIDDADTRRSLEESMKAAEAAEREAQKALKSVEKSAEKGAEKDAEKDIEKGADKGADKGATIHIGPLTKGPRIRIDPPVTPDIALPPEVRERIQRNVVGDMYRIGIGAALVIILIPMFILAVIAKFFIDRSRASQRMADLKRKEADYHRLTQQVTEAKLAALQAQVEPHFLYNTLASVQALTETDPAQASAMTGHLIQYLRNALPKMRESVSTVGQEVELVRAFLNILQMRMGKRLTFEIAIPPELEPLAFPPLMLPSLVENAIKHGLEPQREGGNVRISAERVEGKLRLVVADTGRGFAEAIGTGVGLTNIRERIAALYGDAGKLTLEANEPHGVVATLEVPTDGTRAPAPPPPNAEAEPAPVEPQLAAAPGASVAAQPSKARTATQKTIEVLGAVERVWRKGLSYLFVALVTVAAVLACGAILAVIFGQMPVELGTEVLVGPSGMLIGTAGILLGFIGVALGIAVVVAVVYGLGFLVVGLLIFIPVVVIVSISPIFAPFILIGVLIWWIMRKKKEPEPVGTK